MDLPDFCEFCQSLPRAEETTPFGPDVLVYKVAGKAFALTMPDAVPSRVNLKCDPARALELRSEYQSIQPGFHMNKKHWNTVFLDQSVPDRLLRDLVQHSWDLVVAGLPVRLRKEILS